MQKKVLAEFEKLAKTHKMDLVVDYGYPNTGNAKFMVGWDTALLVGFNFQSTYCAFTVYPGHVLVKTEDNFLWRRPMVQHTDAKLLKSVFQKIDDHLREFNPVQARLEV